MASHSSLAQALATLRTADADLGAFAAVRDDASAEALAQRLQGPLAGQWVAVKDIFDTVDLPTGYGSPLYAGHSPATEAAMVAIIRRAGGLVIAKSVTTEFAFLHPAATLNPAAPGCTPGGSSAGGRSSCPGQAHPSRRTGHLRAPPCRGSRARSALSSRTPRPTSLCGRGRAPLRLLTGPGPR